jgi:hypothetical protein
VNPRDLLTAVDAPPPDTKGSSGKGQTLSRQLSAACTVAMLSPGQWFRVNLDLGKNPSAYAYKLRQGNYLPGEWDAVSRGFDLYIRYADDGVATPATPPNHHDT